jgi:cytochrome c peroxidase
MRKVTIKMCSVILISLMLCSFRTHAFQYRSNRATKLSQKAAPIQVPTGISESLWRQRIPKDNPMSPGKVALGRALYFDKRLSIDGTVSCATCHDPANAFTDSNFVAIGAGTRRGTRNSPTVLNAMFSESLFWDGRARSLEEQAQHPLMSSFEMGMGSKQELISRISSVPEYRRQFKQVFKSEGIDINTIAKAIATYERTLLSGNSPFDRYILGNTKAITDAQRRGWELFKGKAKCVECHTYSLSTPFFADFKFHNTGVAATDTLFDTLVRSVTNSSRETTLTMLAHSAGFSELGRFAVTLRAIDVGAFKTPTLRDVELTSPYMHDGSLKTLIDVVHFYNRGGNTNSHLDERMHPLELTDPEVNDLVEFMRSLTSDDVLRQCQTASPQTRTPIPVR